MADELVNTEKEYRNVAKAMLALTLHHGALGRSVRLCRDWFSAVRSAANGWRRWWIVTMCIAS